MKKLFVWILLLAALGGGGWWAWQRWPDKIAFWRNGAAAAKKPARPTTAVVTPRNISFAVVAAGDIGPADTVSVRPEISGRIATLPVDIGDRARKGQVLFTLDDSDLQIERSTRVTEIAGARLQVERAGRNFERSKQLFAEKLISQELYENTKTEFELSKNSLERAEKSLAQVEDKLSKTKILAPFDCTILTRPVSVGQAVSGASGVNSGTEVLTIANLAEMIIIAHINQADVSRLNVGQSVDVEIEAVPGLKLTGAVDRIAPQATIRNGIKGFSTRILLKNADAQARPGMTANLTIPLISADNVLAVPLAAVFTEQGERFVYVWQGEKFARQPIQIGVADYDFAEVQNGLSGGETVSLVQPEDETGVPAAQAFTDGKPAKKSAGKSGSKSKPGGKGADKSSDGKSSGPAISGAAGRGGV